MASNTPPYRILIVDDSPLMCQRLTDLIALDPDLIVAGVAHDGQEAVRMVSELKPDVITMDIMMPLMNGLEATKQIMAYHPTPIVVITSTIIEKGRNLAFEALSYGALHVIEKKDIGVRDSTSTSIDLALELKSLAQVKAITHPLAKFERLEKSHKSPPSLEKSLIGIVASTGGPQALLSVLKPLPPNFPCALTIVQHISAGFTQGLVDWLNQECSIQVKLAIDKERLQPGHAYIAPTGTHLRVISGGFVRLTHEPPCLGHRPSGTILFESIAESYGDRAIGVILTGMGADGAAGLVRLHAASGKILAQNEATSIIFGMPKAAIDLNIVDWVLPLDQIAPHLIKMMHLPIKNLC